MSRIVNLPCEVTLVPDPEWGLRPHKVTYQDKYTGRRAVLWVHEVADSFPMVNRWWEKEEESIMWRLRLVRGGTIEVEQTKAGWIYYKAYD